MADEYRIHINFLPVSGIIPPFDIFRKARIRPDEDRPSEEITECKLPLRLDDRDGWSSFWVSPTPHEDFEPFTVPESLNVHLTRRMLFRGLKLGVQRSLKPEEFFVPDTTFIEEVSFIMRTHHEGQELLVVQPYFLAATKQFGFLTDFHFRLAKGVPFSRRVQQLSLSLDKNFRRNLDYYSDRLSKIQRSVHKRWELLRTIRLPGTREVTVELSADFVSLPATRLQPKIYVFANGKESKSQFSGLREYGPLRAVQVPPRLLFIFRENDRQSARTLARAIKGTPDGQRLNFPGFRALFKTDVIIDANPIVLQDLGQDSMERALQLVKEENKRSGNLVPMIVLPEGDDNGYLTQKALFSHAEIPTQVCTLRILQNEETLKWAIANLALQVFCKAGGQPWKVRPTAMRSLIIGISQSHRIRVIDDRHEVDKYFAFSVLTDNSGLFQQIEVLGEDRDHRAYLDAFRTSLRQVLATNAKDFARVVIHTSFKLRYDEMDAIQRVVAEFAQARDHTTRFAVIKVNPKSRFFGINRGVNSLVPFEATKTCLGPHEYLMWFEGISPDRTTVSKAFPGPTHLQFLKVVDKGPSPDEERELLQDLVNLSGANWRGFNAKGAPVSVFYCHLVADLVHDFHNRGLPLPAVHDMRPWFL